MPPASTPASNEHEADRLAALRSRLGERVLVCDGAMGTMLHAAGASLDRCLPELNLTQPETVVAVHRAYVAAGADIIETNTFGANRTTMGRFGLNADVEQVNRRAVELARAVAMESDRGVLVAGSIAPAAGPRPSGRAPDQEALESLVEQAAALEAAGVDLLMLETFGDLAALAALLEAHPTSLPVIAQVTFLEDGSTIGGDRPERVAEVLGDLGVTVIGANCALGPRGMRPIVEALARATTLPLCVQPNAGPPTIVQGRFVYRRNEEYFARAANAFVDLGAVIVGGCCGTTPRHIEAIVRQIRASRREAVTAASVGAQQDRAQVPLRSSPGSLPFAEKLARGEFVLAATVAPPDSVDPEAAISEVAQLSAAGADTIVVTATPGARAGMSAISFGLLLRERLGIDVVLTAATWEKSILGLQADLLGAHAFGLRSVICTTGVPPPQGDYPDLSQVFEVSSIDLIETLVGLNRVPDGEARARRSTSFLVGARVNPSAVDREWELERARNKLQAGVDFLVTDPIFSLPDLEWFVESLDQEVPILLGVTPLRDFEHAEYLHFEVPGVTIPDSILSRMRHAGADGETVGREIANELVWSAVGLIKGAIVVPSEGRATDAAALLRSFLGVGGGGLAGAPGDAPLTDDSAGH